MKVISISNISKKFKIHHDKPTTLKEKILLIRKNRSEDFWAIKDISLDIEQGDIVGLIGQNGSGKSTLLKLMTKIIYPTAGEIKINGRVSSLLELGAGFHPDFTGRENIYTNAAIFGLTKKEIDSRLNDIISFSELEEFIDNPVRTYSSGMYMRLAFSVAINVDADILLIDEILAVGDASFQKKCIDKLYDFKRKGVTIVFVAHDMGAVQRLCNKVVWLDRGHIKDIGDPYDIVAKYLEFMGQNKKVKDINQVGTNEVTSELPIDEGKVKSENRTGNRDIILEKIEILDKDNNNKDNFRCGEEFTVKIIYKRKNKKVINPVFGIGIVRNDGVHCYGTNTDIDRVTKQVEIKDSGIVLCKINELLVLQGQYTLDIAVHSIDGFPYDYIRYTNPFSVYSDKNDIGIARLNHEWILDNKKLCAK